MPLVHTPTGYAGMCLDQESNCQPFALQDDTQPTKPHWSEPELRGWGRGIRGERTGSVKSKNMYKGPMEKDNGSGD